MASMNELKVTDTLIDLFEDVGKAHHKAFKEQDGYDPEWPLWYADFLHPHLNKLLRARLTKSEVVYLIVKLDREQRAEAPGSFWPRYYAEELVELYL